MEERNVPIATAQIQYSLMTYKDPLTSGIGEVCKGMGICVIAYSPLCLGLLTGKFSLETYTLSPPGNPRRQLFTELLPGAKELLNLKNVSGGGGCVGGTEQRSN
uniref:NADP-dependent oxidoreductase domain-containing protein n=1 Tax=Proboscia inermis TaxID=420281 RepID=A0A7S0CLZ9_9STRA|mmetsp:Transcript_7837/g.8023  ORF Transcript_7837/g.8023 Transcript_7837/m.8023 type:complete len:104 (+) Transcript_7837:673-984(+)